MSYLDAVASIVGCLDDFMGSVGVIAIAGGGWVGYNNIQDKSPCAMLWMLDHKVHLNTLDGVGSGRENHLFVDSGRGEARRDIVFDHPHYRMVSFSDFASLLGTIEIVERLRCGYDSELGGLLVTLVNLRGASTGAEYGEVRLDAQLLL